MSSLESASILESVHFNRLVIVPNAVQGIFKRRPAAVAVATKLNIDGRAIGLLTNLRESHGDGPLWIRVMTSQTLLLLSPKDVRWVLEGAPEPFAADPEAKRKGMGHFQPDALTISRGELWRERRRFAEAVLETGTPVHAGIGDHAVEVVEQELEQLLAGADELGYDALYAAMRRITRRLVLGDSARDDEELSELLAEMMAAANGMPDEPSEQLDDFLGRIRAYIAKAEPGSLAAHAANAPATPDTRVDHQLTHWLFALGDTLTANLMRAIALLATHQAQRGVVEAELDASAPGAAGIAEQKFLRACLQDAMRLWPTTPLLSRETVSDLTWNGTLVPKGTQVMISNVFFHRDRERIDYADRFAPEEWIDGNAPEDWAFNHFSHGPQGCPGYDLTMLVGSALLAGLLRARTPKLLEPSLGPSEPLPQMLDFFRIRVGLEPRAAA